MNMELVQARKSRLTELISAHQAAREAMSYIESDTDLFDAVDKAEQVYNDILDFPVGSIEVGREKAGYVLSLIEEDCPQKAQIRKFLEAMI